MKSADATLAASVLCWASPAERDVSDDILVELLFVRVHEVTADRQNPSGHETNRGHVKEKAAHDVGGETNHDEGKYQKKGLFADSQNNGGKGKRGLGGLALKR
jgi:hypothetical protein